MTIDTANTVAAPTADPVVVVYTYDTPANRVVWEGSVTDDTVPLAFVDAIRAWLPDAAAGARLQLSNWHYAELSQG